MSWIDYTKMNGKQKCPICDGWGTLGDDACRGEICGACNGSGVVVELAYTADLKSAAERIGSSNLPSPTNFEEHNLIIKTQNELIKAQSEQIENYKNYVEQLKDIITKHEQLHKTYDEYIKFLKTLKLTS